MKTKSILTTLLAILMIASAMTVIGQTTRPDDKSKPVPPSELLPAAGYVQTTDNENNALTGTADFDMDVYLYNDDAVAPIEFNIFITEATVTSAELSILAYDIDWAGGEIDQVRVNGNIVGTLSGVDGTWSTSVFTVNPAFLNPVGVNGGKNLIQIFIDINNEGWAVQCDWGQLVINGTTGGNAAYRYVNLNGTCFTPGQCVQVNSEVDANPSQNVRCEDYLVDPNNNIYAQQNHTFLATTGNEPQVSNLCLPANPQLGTWVIRTIVFDAATNAQQDVRVIPITVAQTCPSAIPTLTEWGLILLGLALLATGTIFLIRRRG